MYDVMEGIKVIEVAEHTFAPVAAMILADWGADVIKIERTSGGGDPGRDLNLPNATSGGLNMYFEAANRGKRSLALDLTKPEGRALLYKLIETTDVFITNLRASARKKMGIEPDDLMKINPRLIYARGSGYGIRGEMADHGGFDQPSSWCRSGSGYMQTPLGGEPPSQPGSIGDLGGGATMAGAISAALFRRERTGKGAIVDHALYLIGIYLMSQSVTAAGLGLKRGPNTTRDQAFNPIVNFYKTRDDRWIYVCLLFEHWWPDFARHLDRPEWLDDPRYKDGASRRANRAELIAEIEQIFASKDYAFWTERLKTLDGVWAPLQSPEEVMNDPQARVNGFVTEITADDGRTYFGGSSPAQFDERLIGPLRSAPAYNAHGEDIMRELGLGNQQIADLRTSGVML